MSWKDEQHWELDWWSDCTNTFGEEAKQITYAHRMGLVNDPVGEHWPGYDLKGLSVIDIGGGPVSMLLKCRNFGPRAVVIEPGDYPRWTTSRYIEKGVDVYRWKGEDLDRINPKNNSIWWAAGFDEAWIYNVLQHVDSPESVIRGAQTCVKPGGVIRIFEWLDIPPCPGHPHELKEALLNDWLGGLGSVEYMNGENGCYGAAYYGTFSV